MIRRIFLLLAVLILFLHAFTQAALLEPQPSTLRQDSLISLGTKLHDEGKYDEAIEVYQNVLKENPSNTVALCEISYSCYAKQDYDDAIRFAQEGTKYNSDQLPLFYLSIGNALNLQGKSEEAIETYKYGIQLAPEFHLLHYNLGFVYYQQDKLDSAKACFQKALRLEPSHPSSHLALGNVYRDLGKGVPMIFALSRFLVLEPNSKRSRDVWEQLTQVLDRSVKADSADTMIINIIVSPDSDAVDGDMTALGLGLALIIASRFTDDQKNKTQIQWLVYGFQNFFQIILELSEYQSSTGFCWDYYAPYFIEMQRRGYTEAFVYTISTSSASEEVSSWLDANQEKITAFLSWSKAYQWER